MGPGLFIVIVLFRLFSLIAFVKLKIAIYENAFDCCFEMSYDNYYSLYVACHVPRKAENAEEHCD